MQKIRVYIYIHIVYIMKAGLIATPLQFPSPGRSARALVSSCSVCALANLSKHEATQDV